MLNCFPNLDDGGRGRTVVVHRLGNQVTLGRAGAGLGDVSPEDALEAAAHIFNSRNAGIDDGSTVKFLRDHAQLTFPCPHGCSEDVIAAGFDQADRATLATIWQAESNVQLDAGIARIENDSRSGKSWREILTRMRAEGIAARAAHRPPVFGGESTIAEAFRRVQLKHANIPVQDDRGGAPPSSGGGGGVIVGSLVVIGLAGAGYLYLRHRRVAMPWARRTSGRTSGRTRALGTTDRARVPDHGHCIATRRGFYAKCWAGKYSLLRAMRAGRKIAEEKRDRVDVIKIERRGEDRSVIKTLKPKSWTARWDGRQWVKP